MKKKILLIPLAVLLLCAMLVPALADDWDTGVATGDWFEYEAKLLQWDGNTTFPSYTGLSLAHNYSDWVRYTITDITTGDVGDNVTFSVLTHWKDGVENSTDLVDNRTSSFSMMIIGANMTVGDVVRNATGWTGERSINETITRDYNNSITREANVLNYTSEFGTSIYNYYYCWDKITGILVYSEFSGHVLSTWPEPNEVIYRGTMEIVDSSYPELEIVPELTGPLLLLAAMSITIPIVILHRRKKFLHLK